MHGRPALSMRDLSSLYVWAAAQVFVYDPADWQTCPATPSRFLPAHSFTGSLHALAAHYLSERSTPLPERVPACVAIALSPTSTHPHKPRLSEDCLHVPRQLLLVCSLTQWVLGLWVLAALFSPNAAAAVIQRVAALGTMAQRAATQHIHW
jgi:hypothetical protein